MYQSVQIIGNLGGDPVLRYTAQGTPVCSFSVATSRSYKLKDSGEMKKETTWWKVTVWNKLAETANEYLHKGSKVFIVGELVSDDDGNPRQWTDKEGKVHASYELRCDSFKFLDGKPSNGGAKNDSADEGNY